MRNKKIVGVVMALMLVFSTAAMATNGVTSFPMDFASGGSSDRGQILLTVGGEVLAISTESGEDRSAFAVDLVADTVADSQGEVYSRNSAAFESKVEEVVSILEDLKASNTDDASKIGDVISFLSEWRS